MGTKPHLCGSTQPQERRAAGRHGTADPAEQSKTMTVPRRRSRLPRQARQRDAGPLEPLIGSFALHLAAEGKAARTVQGLHLCGALVRRRLPSPPGRQDQLGAGGRPGYPAVDDTAARPVQRRLRQHPVPGAAAVLQVARRRGRVPGPDLDLHAREIRIRGKGGTARTVKIGHQAARSLDRYLRARARHAQAHRPQLWLGVNNRGPLTPTGIYQIVARRGRQCGVNVYPHRFRHHFSHTWLDRGGAERDLMELNGWTSPQMLTRYGASARGARARRSYDRIMDDT